MKKHNLTSSVKVLLYLGGAFSAIVAVYAVSVMNSRITLSDLSEEPRSEAQVQILPLPQTAVFRATQAFNQMGSVKDVYDGAQTAWFGSDRNGYLGLQFNGLSIPGWGRITRATLSVTSQKDQWNNQSTIIYGEKSYTPVLFSNSSLPSSRVLTSKNVPYADNVKWTTNTKYQVADVTPIMQELYGTDGVKNTSLVLRGNGTKYGRKFIYGTASDRTPTLEVQYIVTLPASPTR